MRLAGALVPSFADDQAVLHQHAADAWIRRGREHAARSELQRTRHVFFVVIGNHAAGDRR
jgi:hypothetical protein